MLTFNCVSFIKEANMKKLISILLIVCMVVLSIITCFAVEDSDFIYLSGPDIKDDYGYSNFCEYIKFDTKTKTMYLSVKKDCLSGRFFQYDYTHFVSPLTDEEQEYIDQRENLLKQSKKIVVEEGVYYILDEYFHDLTNLEKIVLPDSLIRIGEYAFYNCSKLKSVYCKNVKVIRSAAFARCKSLKSVNFPNSKIFSPYRFEVIDQEFLDFIYPIHESYVGAFQECTSLEKVSCPLVQDIGAKTFYKCSKLTTINNNVLDKVKNIGHSAFFGCKSLRSIALNSVKTLSSNVDGYCDSEMQEGTFGYCTNLKSVEIYNVKTIGDGTFYGCTNLSKINRNNVLTSVRYIGKYAFANCKSLKTITAYATKVDSGYWNYYKKGYLKKWRDAKVGTYLPDTFGGYAGKKYCGAFQNCTNLRTVNLPNIREIRSTTFNNCTKLTKVNIPENTQKIWNSAFYNCTSLRTFTIPKGTYLISARAFAKCRNLKTINIKSNNFSIIGLNAFKMIGKKPTFNCPKKKVKTYKKLIKPHSPSDSKFVGKFK